MRIAAILMLLPIGLRAMEAFAPIVEGARYEYRFERQTNSATSIITSSVFESGTQSILIADVRTGGDSSWFTIQARQTSHISIHCQPGCSSESDDTTSFSKRFLLRRDTLFEYADSTRLIRPGIGGERGYPMMAYSGPYKTIQIDPFTGENDGPVNVLTTLKDSILRVDFSEGAERDTTYYLEGVGAIYSQHSDKYAFHSFQEKYQLISRNGAPFRLEDHLHLDHPLAVGPHAPIQRGVRFKGLGVERLTDPLGRRHGSGEAVPAMPLFLLR